MTAIDLLRKEKEELKKKINAIDIRLCKLLENKEKHRKAVQGLNESYYKLEETKRQLNIEYGSIQLAVSQLTEEPVMNCEEDNSKSTEEKETSYMYLFIDRLLPDKDKQIIISSNSDIDMKNEKHLNQLLKKFAFNNGLNIDTLKFCCIGKSEVPVIMLRKDMLTNL